MRLRGGDRLVERDAEGIGRVSALELAVADEEGRRGTDAGAARAVAVGFDEARGGVAGHAIPPRLRLHPVRDGEGIEGGHRVALALPALLGGEERLVHLPELVLHRCAHGGFGGGLGVGVDAGERKVEIGDARLAGPDVLAVERGEGGVVPLLAEGALEVAHLDEPHGRVGGSTDAAAVGGGADGVGEAAHAGRRGAGRLHVARRRGGGAGASTGNGFGACTAGRRQEGSAEEEDERGARHEGDDEGWLDGRRKANVAGACRASGTGVHLLSLESSLAWAPTSTPGNASIACRS